MAFFKKKKGERERKKLLAEKMLLMATSRDGVGIICIAVGAEGALKITAQAETLPLPQ